MQILDICLLGAGDMMPLPYHWLTSMMAHCNGSLLPIDCDEDTQVALREKGWSPYPIDVIYFTHYHADHISGLPGPLLTMGNTERIEPFLMIGPKGLEHVVTALRSIASKLPFPIVFSELTEAREQRTIDPYVIDVYRVNHNMLCYGYCISISRIGRFDAAWVKEQGIPLRLWSPLQRGQTITDGDKVYTPDMTLSGTRHSLKISYCTDTCPIPVTAEYAADADLVICEGMYGEADKQQKAREHKHMTMQEVAKLTSETKPEELWLTHYSPPFNYPEEYMAEIRKVFPTARAAKDGWTMELVFPEGA